MINYLYLEDLLVLALLHSFIDVIIFVKKQSIK